MATSVSGCEKRDLRYVECHQMEEVGPEYVLSQV